MAPLSKIVAAAALALGASAKTIRIDVGKSGLSFEPNSVTAAVGDVLAFYFDRTPHSVVRGDYTGGCKPVASGGFSSDTVMGSSGSGAEVFSVTVTDTNPIFFYCSVASHCQAGMVGVVNPSSDMTLAGYTSAAKGSKSNVHPEGGVFGGQLGNGPASATSGGSTTGSPSATSSSGTAASGSSASTAGSPSSTGRPSSASAPSGSATPGAGASTAPSMLVGLGSLVAALLMG